MRELANLCLTSNSLAPAIFSTTFTREWLLHLASFPVHTISAPIPTYIVSCSVYQARKAPKPRMISFSGGMISGTGLAEPVDCLSAWPAGKVCFSRVEEDNDPAGPGHRCIAAGGPIVGHSPSPPVGRARKPVFHFWRCRRANIQLICVVSLPPFPYRPGQTLGQWFHARGENQNSQMHNYVGMKYATAWAIGESDSGIFPIYLN
jgi:hypothetical protein